MMRDIAEQAGETSGGSRGMSTAARPIEPWAAGLILSGVNRLDAAITTLGCVMMDLDDDPEAGASSTVEAIRWLYQMLGTEADNIRKLVDLAQEPHSVSGEPASVETPQQKPGASSRAPRVLEDA